MYKCDLYPKKISKSPSGRKLIVKLWHLVPAEKDKEAEAEALVQGLIDDNLNPDRTKSNCTKELLGKVKALFNFDHLDEDDAQAAQEPTEKSVTVSCKQPKQKKSGEKKNNTKKQTKPKTKKISTLLVQITIKPVMWWFCLLAYSFHSVNRLEVDRG